MKEKKKSKLPVIAVIIFIILVGVLYALLYLIPQINGSRIETVVVNYASIRDASTQKCIIARTETLYSAQTTGTVSYYVEEGAKTRKSSQILDLYYGYNKYSSKAASTGIVSYYTDGYEAYFSPSSFAELDADEVGELDKIIPESRVATELQKDDPMYKLITSDTWYIIIVLDIKDAGKYQPMQKLSAKFSDGTELSAAVEQIVKGEKYQLVICSLNRYYEGFARLRTTELEIISSTTEGLLIPTDAIGTNGENFGVYVLGLDGDYSFRSIEVLIEGEKETLIKDGGNVKLYDEILKDARKYKQ